MSNQVTIEIATSDLKDALNIAQNTLSSATDITSHFVFVCEGDKAFVMSSDLPRTFSKIPLTGGKVVFPEDDDVKSARFTVSGKRILSAVAVTDGVVNLKANNAEVIFESAKGSLTFSGLDPSAFPPWETKLSEVQDSAHTVSADCLADVLNALKPYVSQDEARRPELCLVAFINGVAYGCDGFGLGLARHESFKDVDGVKIHIKDLGSMYKYLRAHSGNDVEIMSSSQATFLKMPDGAVYGFMDLPFTYPNVTQKYSDAFDYFPNRSWAFSKGIINTALAFLNAGAAEGDTTCIFTHSLDNLMTSPRIEMNSANGKGHIGYDLDEFEPTIALAEGQSLKDFDYKGVKDLGLQMIVGDRVKRAQAEPGKEYLSTFKFNSAAMKRILDTMSEYVYFGVERESADRGYLVFKNSTPTGVEVASVVGWVR